MQVTVFNVEGIRNKLCNEQRASAGRVARVGRHEARGVAVLIQFAGYGRAAIGRGCLSRRDVGAAVDRSNTSRDDCKKVRASQILMRKCVE